MKQVINTKNIPIKMWLDDIEGSAIAQVHNLAQLPFAYRHIAIMPDSHCGYGMPIGAVLATTGQVIPNAVGVDIGCGMRAVKLPTKAIPTRQELTEICARIRRLVPLGAKKFSNRANHSKMPSQHGHNYEICMQEYDNAAKSLGTLGGGNHFIELQEGSDGHLWVMVHSGSRNLGHKVATHYNKIAVNLNQQWSSPVPKGFELAHLPIDSQIGIDYLSEMNYCVEFAKANRREIMDSVLNAVYSVFEPLDNEPYGHIDIAHNYARIENHFGKNVMIHRKGATSAREGEIGIIPGSQGTSSYIVSGKGERESFMSCSHGAGRSMSRSYAKQNLDLDAEIKQLDDMGVVHGVRHISDLDEAPSSYKDIKTVMENQSDLVDILVELKPLAVVKG
jgi:tRNA-splicing ligase RtcB